MPLPLRSLAVFSLLCAGLFIAGPAVADGGSADPGFSWKPKPAKPPPAATPAPAPTPPRTHTAAAPAPKKDSAPPPADAPAPPPPPNGGAPLSAEQLTKLYQGLSSTARQALEDLLKTKGVDALSKMSEDDARTTFGGMPTNVRNEIQAKWDGLSDEQRTGLKKLKPDDFKKFAASQAKEIVQASVAPILKPVETVVKATEAAIDKTKSALKKGRDYVQKMLSRFFGAKPDKAPDEPTPPKEPDPPKD